MSCKCHFPKRKYLENVFLIEFNTQWNTDWKQNGIFVVKCKIYLPYYSTIYKKAPKKNLNHTFLAYM